MVQGNYPPRKEEIEVFRVSYVVFFGIGSENPPQERFSTKLIAGEIGIVM